MTECRTRCLRLIDVGVVRLDGAGDISVEVLSPGPRQPRVGALRLAVGLGVDAEGGPPHSHVADECGARVPSGGAQTG